MSKLTDTFFRAVVYKAVWRMPWWMIVGLIGLIAFVAWGAVQTYIGIPTSVVHNIHTWMTK